MVNGEVVGQFDSNPATPFTAFDIQGTGVENITFTTVGLTANDWISLFEVSDSPCNCRMAAHHADDVEIETTVATYKTIPKNNTIEVQGWLVRTRSTCSSPHVR